MMWTTGLATQRGGRFATTSRPRPTFWIEIGLTVVVLLLPLIFGGWSYGLRLVLDIAMLSILALSLTLIFGFTGQISLGQAAFYAFGAYSSAIVQEKLGVPFWAAWIFAIVFTMAIAWLISLPLLRISGHFLALGTLALGLIVETLLIQFVDLTGGHSGILLPKAEYIAPLATVFPFVIVIALALSYWLVRNLTERSLGRSFLALRDDPAGAAALGIPVTRYKSLVFAIGGGLAATAGILYSHHFQVITPEVFGFHMSLEVLIIVVIGGMSSRVGAILGAAVVILLPEMLRGFPVHELEGLVYGLLVLIFLLFLPGGIVGGLTSLWRRITGSPAPAKGGRV